MILKEFITDAPLPHGHEAYNCHSMCHVAIADSVSELADAVASIQDRGVGSDFDRYDFYGRRITGGIRQCAEMASATWSEGLEIVEGMLRDISTLELPRVESKKRRRRWSEDSGDDICLDRLRSGQDFWRETYRANVKTKGVITIVTDIRAACGVSHEDILWRGAAAVALTYLLESSGYRVDLWASQAAGNNFTNHHDMLIAANVKSPSQKLDIGSAVSAVSGWFLRTIGFHAANMFEPVPSCTCGYDRAGGLRLFADRYFIKPGETGFIVENVWNRSAAIELVTSAADAVNRGDISACKWAYSPWNKATA